MLAFLGAILPSVFKIVDKAVPDKDAAQKLKSEIQMELMNNEAKALSRAADIVIAEAQGHSWMQRNWRPSLMFLFGFIIANNYVIYPYASLYWTEAPFLDTPEPLWDLIKIGLGGYVLGRSGEKIAKEWKA